MADILKISTPLVEKLPIQNARPVADPSVPFDLSNVTKVIQPGDASEILQQNTGFVPKEDNPKILADLLKDPSVTVSLIRNLYLLQEVIGLIPANNTALTEEIESLFAALLLQPEDIAAELVRQEGASTLFKGDLFDTLRAILVANGEKPEVANDIGQLLKGLNAAMSQRDALDSVVNNLTYLADATHSSPRLSESLETLIAAFRAPDAAGRFPELKQQVMAVLKEVQSSILFTPKMEKILPLVVYNLSRFNDNADFLPNALGNLLAALGGSASKSVLIEQLQAYVDRFIGGGNQAARATEDDSRVMNAIAKIIGRQVQSEEVTLLSGEQIEKIVHSLLSSPTNFTPLLHFVVPVEVQDLRAFAEIWIDPNAEEETGARNTGGMADNLHMLMVFDVEGVGRFESELYVQGKRIAMNLMCPPAHLDDFKDIGANIRKAVSAIGYSFEAITVGKLQRTHSLMEIFTNLPRKRTGVDVKV